MGRKYLYFNFLFYFFIYGIEVRRGRYREGEGRKGGDEEGREGVPCTEFET
jgi:hypothetical protein